MLENIKQIPYPLYQNYYAPWYPEYLENLKKGKKYRFNIYFLFFNLFWLIRYKMYTHFLMYLVLASAFTQIIFMDPYNYLFYILTFFGMNIIFSFGIGYEYHKTCLNRINYKEQNPIKKLKPMNFLVTVIVTIPLFFIGTFILNATNPNFNVEQINSATKIMTNTVQKETMGDL